MILFHKNSYKAETELVTYFILKVLYFIHMVPTITDAFFCGSDTLYLADVRHSVMTTFDV